MSADLVPTERLASGVIVVRLEQPGRPVVVLDEALMRRLERTLAGLPGQLAGVILASASERVFVAGADLKAIAERSDAELRAYLAYGSRVFAMLSNLPCPTCAAIHGAALGGGLEIAMHCDGLIGAPGAKPYPVGLPEAGLSICPGWGGTNLLPARIDARRAIEMTARGTPMKYPEAQEAGLFDVVAPEASQLISAAEAWLLRQPPPQRDGAPQRWIGRPGVADRVREGLASADIPETEPGAAVRSAVEAGLAVGWGAALDVEQRELTRLRSAPAGRAAIEAFFQKTS
ncbi:MAG: enoyl-CoA hydratase/isomerase family protein [Phycisphaerales bacterium JB039]